MTQTEAIKHHLLHLGPLTHLEALQHYQCSRLAARVKELRREGMAIETEMIKCGRKRWARYRLAGQQQC